MNKEYIKILTPFLKKIQKLVLDNQNKITKQDKPDGSIVTSMDIKISDLFQKLIKKNFKGHTILDEEKALKDKDLRKNILSSEYTWIIDPIDGTKTYFYGSYLFATAISLYKNNLPKFSLIFLPYISQLIYTDNKNVYKITNFNTNKEKKTKIVFKKRVLNKNSLVYFPVKCAKNYIKNYKFSFIDGYSSYIYTYDVFTNIAFGAFLKDNVSMWDVYSSLPLAKMLGMEIYNINDGSTLEELTFDLFKDDLKVKNIWLITHPIYKEEMFSILH